jgi:phage internal scaffolding protein
MAKSKLTSFRSREQRRVPEYFRLVDHKTGEISTPPSLTKQSFVPECDINNILRSYRATGQINHMRANAAQGVYEDLPDPIDFQTSLNILKEANDSFDSLPAAVRRRFGNDPREFLAFVTNPANQDEIIKMGLAVDNRPPPEPTPTPEDAPPDV